MEKHMETTIRVIQGVYWDTGKENRNYYLWFWVQGLGMLVSVYSGCPIWGTVNVERVQD